MKYSIERQHTKRPPAKKIRLHILNKLTTAGISQQNFNLERACEILAPETVQNFFTSYLQKNIDKIYRRLA